MKKNEIFEIEILPSHWVEVKVSELTDESETSAEGLPIEAIDGGYWYLDGDYTTPPKQVRLKK